MSLSTPPKKLTEPRVIDRYELKAILGQGGMGLVYQAYDRVVRRDVALKTIKGSPSRMALDLFRKECSVLAAICHPNIIEIFDIGEFDENGETKPYFVMPLLPGASLDALIHKTSQRLSVERVVEIVVQTCRGLHAAHENNIVHRDLKPSNIFVMPDDSVKIIDFGVVHMIDTRTTMTVAAGTPAYMSPEQIQGQMVSKVSDLFSLGVVIYESLTGRAPFQGAEKEIEEAILHQVPPAVSELNPAVSPALSRVVHKAMAKQALHRFANARELADTIQKAFRNESIEIFDSNRILPRIQRAARAAEQGDYQFAQDIIDELDAEGHLDPAITALRSQVEKARRQKSIQQLLDAARTRIDQDEYLLALQKIQQVLQLDPGNVSALALQKSVERRQSEQKVDEWFRVARQHLDNSAFVHARSALQNVLQLRGTDSRALQMLADIDRREQEHQRIRKEKEQLYQAALEAWQGGEVTTALTKLERLMELESRAPDTTSPDRGLSIQSFYNQVRSEHDSIKSGYEEARKSLADRNFVNALAICEQYLSKYPGHALFQALKYDIDERQRQDRSARIAEIDRRVQAEPDLDRRVNFLKEALDQYPGDPHFEQDLRTARDKRDLVNSIVARARTCEEQGQFNDALGQWEILQSVHGSYPGLGIEIQRVRNRRDQQMRAEAKAHWVEQVDRQLEAGEYPRASDLLQAALLEFPADPELTELQNLVRQGSQRLAEAQNFIAQAQGLFRDRRYTEGLEIVRRLRQLDEHSTGVVATVLDLLLDHAKTALETDWRSADLLIQEALILDPANTLGKSIRVLALDKKREEFVNACVQRIRSLQTAGDLEEALTQAKQGLASYPNDPRLLQLSASLNKALQEYRRKRDEFVNQCVSRVQQLKSAGNLPGALAALEQAVATYPAEPRLTQPMADLRKEFQLWQRRQDELASQCLERAAKLRDAGDLAGAFAETEKGLVSCPQDARLKSLQELLQEALAKSREEFVRNCVSLVQELEKKGDPAEAVREVDQALAIHPGDPTLVALAAKTKSAFQKWQRQQEESILRCLSGARQLQQAGKLESALEQVQQGLTSHPADSRLLQLAATLQNAMDDLRYRREEFIARCLAEARKLQHAGNPEAALARIEQGLASCPDATALQNMQAQLRTASEAVRQKRLEFVSACLSQSRESEAAGDLPAALKRIQDALSRYPGDPELVQSSDRLQRSVQELHRQSEELISGILELQEAGNLEAALASAEQALAGFPKDAKLVQLAAQLRQQLQDRKRQREESIAWYVGRARQLRQSGDLDGALAQIDDGLASYPQDPALEDLKLSLKRDIDSIRRRREELVARFAADARSFQEAGDFKAALAKLEEGLVVYPNDSLLLPLAASLRKTFQEIQKKREEGVAQCVIRVRELQESGNLEAALGQADRGLATYADDPRLLQLRAVLSKALEDRRLRRTEFVARCIEQAQSLRQAGNLKGALTQVEHGLASFPDEPSLRDVEVRLHEALEHERRTRDDAILACLAEARALQSNGDLEGSLARIRRGLAGLPGEPRLAEAAESLQKLLSGETRRREELVTACLSQARQSQAAGDLRGALEQVIHGLSSCPEDARLLHLRHALQKALDEALRKREELISRCIHEIRQLQSSGDLKSALAQGNQALSLYPGEPRLVDLHAAIVQAYEEQRGEKEELVTQCLMRARQFEARDDLKAALAEIERALAAYPAEPRLAQARSELKARMRRPWRRRPIAYAPVALLVAAVAVYFATRPSSIKLVPNPQELHFDRYQIGSPAPEARFIEWHAPGVAFEAVPSVPWLVIDPASGSTLGRLQVSIKPEALTPGILTGMVTIKPNTKATVTANPGVPVTITVVEADRSPVPKPSLPSLPEKPLLVDPLPPLTYQKGDRPPGPQLVRVRQGRVIDCQPTATWLQARMTRQGCWVSVDPAGLVPRLYSAALILKGSDGNKVDAPVNLEVKEAPQQKPPPPPPPPPPKRLTTRDYNGPLTGMRTWTGTLAPGGEVQLDAKGETVQSGGGTLSGTPIPLVVLSSLEISSNANGVTVLLKEDRVMIQNTTNAPVYEVGIHWRVKN